LSGWVSFLLGFAGPGAATAFSSAKYLLGPFHGPGAAVVWIERSLATVLVLAFAAIHVSGRRQTARVQVWITVIKLVLLGAFAMAGLAVGWPRAANLVDPVPVDGRLALVMLSSLVYIYYAYTGWNAASYLAGEVREPQRLLPRAILLGTGGVLVLYLAVNVVYALALSPADIRAIIDDPANHQNMDAVAPIAELAAARLFGAGWSASLSVAVGVMLLSSLSVYLLIGPRVLFAMALAGHFPTIAARLTPRASTPAVATAFQVAMTLIWVWIGTVESLIMYAGVGLSIFSMLAMSAIFVLRWKRPDLPRPFRTPGYPITPAVYLVLTGLMTLAAFSERPLVSTYALLSILAGVPVYYLWHAAKGRKPASGVGP